MKIGQKPHKYNKKFDPMAYDINIYSEREPVRVILQADEKIENELDYIYNRWSNSSELPNPEKFTKQRYLDEQERERQARIQKSIDEDNLKAKREWPGFAKAFNTIMKKYRKALIDEDPENNDPSDMKYLMNWSSRVMRHKKERDEFINDSKKEM